jgi:hypothetical protein
VAAVRYANERQQFGRTIDHFAPVRAMLFDNAAEIEAARAIVVTTAAVVDRKRGLERAGGGEELARYERLAELLTPLSKYHACEMVNAVTSRAIQVHGGYGYSTEYPVERHFRDGRITSIYEGTSEIQVGAMIEPLLKGGLPLLFEEPPPTPRSPGLRRPRRAARRLRDGQAAEAAKADRLPGRAAAFADAADNLWASSSERRREGRPGAILAKRQARRGRSWRRCCVSSEGDRAASTTSRSAPWSGTTGDDPLLPHVRGGGPRVEGPAARRPAAPDVPEVRVRPLRRPGARGRDDPPRRPAHLPRPPRARPGLRQVDLPRRVRGRRRGARGRGSPRALRGDRVWGRSTLVGATRRRAAGRPVVIVDRRAVKGASGRQGGKAGRPADLPWAVRGPAPSHGAARVPAGCPPPPPPFAARLRVPVAVTLGAT